jgi:branched-chain amino acid aminotransferase
MIEKVDYIWMDGEFVDWDKATVHLLTHSLHYGLGVFEGIRCYKTKDGPAIFRLTDHMRRLHRSAKIHLIKPKYSVEELVEVTKELVRRNKVETCYIRPIMWLGYGEMGLNPMNSVVHTAVALWPWGTYLGEEGLRHGVRVRISSFRRLEPNIIPHAAKATGQYINSILAKVEALQSGYDEAILLNTQGFVTDGSGENIFHVRDGVITTPPLSSGALEGITRDTILVIARDLGYETREADLVRSDLYIADELFFTGTAAEVVPIREVDGREIGEPGPITRKCQEVFFSAVHGEDERYKHWLEFV